MNSYKTVAGEGRAEIYEKKSRFIAHVSPAANEAEAAEFIAKIKKKHYDATHNIFAYRAGLSAETLKASDDGEPSGTAGIPVLDILLKEDIRNCVIVVTRYFGGTLLGTGGLVRAYSKAAKEGLSASGVTELSLCVMYRLTVDYHTYGKVKYELEKEGFKITGIIYTEAVNLEMLIKEEQTNAFLQLITSLCAGRETLEKKGVGYYGL